MTNITKTTTLTTRIEATFTQEEVLKILCKAADVPYSDQVTIHAANGPETTEIVGGISLKHAATEKIEK